MSGLRMEFCGEWVDVPDVRPFVIGREGDLDVDDNPYLHRRFLEVSRRDQLWWVANVGSQLSATLSDEDGRFQAWLAPGAHLPMVFPAMRVRFTAGPTTYEVGAHIAAPPYDTATVRDAEPGDTTLGKVTLTPEQHLLLVALAEPVLRSTGTGRTDIPSSAAAAARLEWPLTKFNRKLDNVCQKLKRAGVRGLHGEAGNLASARRARLVEYGLATRLVTPSDVALLASASGPSGPETPPVG